MDGTANNRCATRYPIVLVHGAGFRDLKWPSYWGRVPAALEREGARIHYGLQDSWGSIETNAEQIARRIDEIIAESGCGKVNIIAHSKGGLDSRMAASSLGCADRIASITTVGTPHHGSKTLDRIYQKPRSVWNIAAFAVNNWIRLIGDKKPDFMALCRDLTTEGAGRFNKANPDPKGVFCQSVACVMHGPLSDITLSVANFVISRIEGENDGLVSVESAEWGENFRVIRGNGRRGISHIDEIDFRRSELSKRPGEGVNDIPGFYIGLVEELKNRGF